jgi:hypothetical protein
MEGHYCEAVSSSLQFPRKETKSQLIFYNKAQDEKSLKVPHISAASRLQVR